MTRSNLGPEGGSRMQLLVVFLLALALMAAILAIALGTGLLQFAPGGPQAGISPTPPAAPIEPPGESPATESPEPTAEPTAEATPPPEQSPPPEPGPTVQPTPGGVYVVQSGDTLEGISLLFGVPMQAIIEANEITNPDLLQVGQQLIIPLPPEATPGPQVHTVQAGESIIGIAEQYEVDPTELADFNFIEDWNSIQIGQQLWIPGTEPEGWERPTSSPTP